MKKRFIPLLLFAFALALFFGQRAVNANNSNLWQAEYYPNQWFSGQPVYRSYQALNFDWQGNAPVPGIPADNFSVRFRKQIWVDQAGMYRFNGSADDTMRVLVDGQHLLQINAVGQKITDIHLNRGTHYIYVEYKEFRGWAHARLTYQRVGDGHPTPTPSPTPPPVHNEAPIIDRFDATVKHLPNGDDLVTFNWSVRNANYVQLWTGYTDHTLGTKINVSSSGTTSILYSEPTLLDANAGIIVHGDGIVLREETKLRFNCTINYFFDLNKTLPISCPLNEPVVRNNGAFQTFERGAMIYLPANEHNSRDMILVLMENVAGSGSGSYSFIEDTWREGQPSSDPNIHPPANRQQPIRGFGKVWRENPYVRENLGWALSAEQGYQVTTQAEDLPMVFANGHTYISLPNQSIMVRLTTTRRANISNAYTLLKR